MENSHRFRPLGPQGQVCISGSFNAVNRKHQWMSRCNLSRFSFALSAILWIFGVRPGPTRKCDHLARISS